MGREILYYLVARNKMDNSVSVIPVNGQDGNSLETIDLFTTNYNNDVELSLYLLEQGLITDPVDLFIINKNNGKVEIQEVVYSSEKQLRSIAEDSSKKMIVHSVAEIDSLLDDFATRMEEDTAFYNMVMYDNTNIYGKYLEYFKNSNLSGEVNYQAKFMSNSWARKSYKLIRNIIEAIKRYENPNYYHNVASNRYYREMISSKLYDVTEEVSNQMSLFDNLEEKDDEEKILEILSTFDRMELDDFIISGFGKIIINSGKINFTSDVDKESFTSLLSDDLVILASKMVCANFKYQTDLYENFRNQMVNMLGTDSRLLDATYEWIKVFNKYRKPTEFGDVSGRQYRKEEC